ncbi:MAG: MerR family transcriptional regulator [Bacteroidetes bacterium]|nr:MerR family transcriptional regulator [Bacteroidota bacterium]
MKDLQIKKLYYSISEVSKMLGLEQYVLRYWETEFEQLRPQKNRAGNRIYTEKDIEIVKLIKRLTREDRYTIEGARQVMGTLVAENGTLREGALEEHLRQMKGGNGEQQPVNDTLQALRTALVELRSKL